MELRNISPLGDLDVTGVGVVKAGATFEATGEHAESLLQQTANFERADKPKPRASKDEE